MRELSQKFDDWNPKEFRLTRAQIDECVKSLPKQKTSSNSSALPELYPG